MIIPARKMELIISNVLRYGVILCGLILAVGIIMGFMEPRSSIATQLPDLLNGQRVVMIHPELSDKVILLGLFLLISLPTARVASTVILFLLEEEWIYVGITFFVLTMLIISFIFGKKL